MFKKRKIPAADAASSIRMSEGDEEPEAPDSNVDAIKRNKIMSTSGILVKHTDGNPDTHAEQDAKTDKNEEILDGIALEEAIEARRLSNPAVVTVEDEKVPKKTSKFGPSSAPAYVRATTIIDYKPDLCKDYNQTGYCGYGDTCIYLHDRTTYVAGNVLDQRWDDMVKSKNGKKEEVKSATNSKSCGICGKSLSPPVVKTRCGHSFCRACAFERFDNSSTCATCGLQTMGIFNDVKM